MEIYSLSKVSKFILRLNKTKIDSLSEVSKIIHRLKFNSIKFLLVKY